MSRPISNISINGWFPISCALAIAHGVQPAAADTASWLGSAGNAWANSANWSLNPLVVPGTGDFAIFDGAGSGNTTLDLGTGVGIGNILLNSACVAAYTIAPSGEAPTKSWDSRRAVPLPSIWTLKRRGKAREVVLPGPPATVLVTEETSACPTHSPAGEVTWALTGSSTLLRPAESVTRRNDADQSSGELPS
ncbi:hypothetical protein HNR46_003724 [Haloferula luteola]|uniref:Uncharacterized protein n=1 Tax=Haloferula luteola TaxID=595692 RepID=A0A840V713_9BACT|nr:hypothetical protein [Haloferula luteola]MBB5353463.1 hypothetical protein [Haloferula luteola]